MEKENVKRVNVNIKDNIGIPEALYRVMKVTMEDRISGDSFCYHTEFKDDVCVSAKVTKVGNDSFTVYKK